MTATGPTGVCVVIPTYRRPDDLKRCLAGLEEQSLPPIQTIVVRRAGDAETEEAVGQCGNPGLIDIVVSESGVLAAMRAGTEAAQGDIVAFIDDDAVPRADWLWRLVRHFEDPSVGGVGGRDFIAQPDSPNRPMLDVGRISRWGKLIGNHHRGTGEPRKVMVLKAAGMAFRRTALAFPAGLRGAGAQVHFEVGMSLSALRRGWTLIYDPTAVVDHRVAPRFDADQRGSPDPSAVRDAAFNLVTCLVSEVPALFWRRALYGLAIGDRALPGLLRAAVALVRNEKDVLRNLRPSLQGQIEALWHASRGPDRAHSRAPETPLVSRATRRRRLRVALLAHDIHGEGGMERACLELIRRGSDDIDFVIISSRLDPSVRATVTWRRVPIPARPAPLKFLVYYLIAGLRLTRERVDLVQTVGAIVPNKVDIASIHFCHAAFADVNRGHSATASQLRKLNTQISHWLALVAERWSYRPDRVRLFAAVSEGVAQEIKAAYPGVETVVTTNGVDHDRFAPDPEAYRRARAEIGVDPNAFVALFVGGDWDRKGLAVAIRGLAYARESGVPATLWVVGPGERARFAQLAAELGVGEDVRFFGHRSDPERFYKAADACVLPTLYETFCIAAFEAAAAGLPLVVTAVHGAADLVARGAGIGIDRTGESVGAALAHLGADAELRASMGSVGRKESRSFTWGRSVQAVTSGYDRILTQRAG